MAKKVEKIIDGIKWYPEVAKKMKVEDFVKAHLGILPFAEFDLDFKTGKLKAGQPKATEALNKIYKEL